LLEEQMLRKEQNEFITRTDPSTPMGQLFRCYWTPALLSEELPQNDCPPARVKLLSERLVAFRDSQGRYGLIDEFCAHRGASLWFGRNEECGLRCPYHGWKFDVTGQCLEVPSEPVASGFAQRIKLKSYPLIEQGGVLWTHTGPPDRTPPLPQWEFSLVPADQRFVSRRLQECNWLQAMEGGIDSSHVSWLHRANVVSDPLFKGAKGNEYNMGDMKPVFEVVESAGGLYIGARRNAENDQYYWRITQYVLPSFTMIAPRGGHTVHGHFWIPVDDENCWAWSYDYRPDRTISEAERTAMVDGKGVHVKYVPGTYRPLANKENDYLMDRTAQRAGTTYSGVDGIAMQDASLQESMGPIVDRTKENLVSTDNGIIHGAPSPVACRQGAGGKGRRPAGIDPEHHKVRSAAIVLPRDRPYKDAAAEHLRARAGSAHVSV
jgi:phthalate 4,5-dioxygenase